MRFKILPPLSTLTGGPKTFALYMTEAAKEYTGNKKNTLLIINSYKNIFTIFLYRFVRGYTVIQRVGSPYQILNSTGAYIFFKNLASLFNMVFISYLFADKIVYQSDYTRSQWALFHILLPKRKQVIHNPVSIPSSFVPSAFHADNTCQEQFPTIHLLIVETNMVKFEQSIGFKLFKNLYNCSSTFPLRMSVIGNILDRDSCSLNSLSLEYKNKINFYGLLPRISVLEAINSSSALISCETLTGSCPNVVLEALLLSKLIICLSNSPASEIAPSNMKLELNSEILTDSCSNELCNLFIASILRKIKKLSSSDFHLSNFSPSFVFNEYIS